MIKCDNCDKEVTAGNKRYKSKIHANYDICQGCFEALEAVHNIDQQALYFRGHQHRPEELALMGHQRPPEYIDQFYVIENATDEDILHEYHTCNMCGAEPIWGIRFKCSRCEDVDLCELCFDQRLKKLNLKNDPQQQHQSE